jgi:23S rRNA pseudouridine1911/1915/1917 synthase
MEKLNILFEDNHLLVVNKPAGMSVQSNDAGIPCLDELVKKYIKEKFNKPGDVFLGVTHRIDTPVSGAVILARTSKALARINEAFRNREVKKTYWAVVSGRPERNAATLRHWIRKDHSRNFSKIVPPNTPEAQEAVLDYKLIASTDHHSLLEINLHTGRHHQIRVQLAAMGFPIRGDVKYGARRGNGDGSINLHSRFVSFPHPVSKEMMGVLAPVPNDPLWTQLEALASEASL